MGRWWGCQRGRLLLAQLQSGVTVLTTCYKAEKWHCQTATIWKPQFQVKPQIRIVDWKISSSLKLAYQHVAKGNKLYLNRFWYDRKAKQRTFEVNEFISTIRQWSQVCHESSENRGLDYTKLQRKILWTTKSWIKTIRPKLCMWTVWK